jgi:hypothetical protein
MELLLCPFFGHVIGKEGISADLKKTAAIRQMKAPSTVSELRRFMGMVNQLSKFTPHIAETSKPLTQHQELEPGCGDPVRRKPSKKLKRYFCSPQSLPIMTLLSKQKFQPMHLPMAWVRYYCNTMMKDGSQSCLPEDQCLKQRVVTPRLRKKP